MVTLQDCYAGPSVAQTQAFGVNPAAYARFGLAGHDGIDIGLPNDTPVLAATDGTVIKVGFDPPGYGTYIEVWDPVQHCATIYGHLRQALVGVGQAVKARQRIGLSDNTGNSTGPHLHFGLCFTDSNGIRLQRGNGFFGWVDPNNPANARWSLTGQEFTPAPAVPLLEQVRGQRDAAWVRLEQIRQLATGDGRGGPNPPRL